MIYEINQICIKHNDIITTNMHFNEPQTNINKTVETHTSSSVRNERVKDWLLSFNL